MSQWIQAVLNAGTFKAWAKQLWKDAPMRSRQALLAVGVAVLLSFCTGTAFGAQAPSNSADLSWVAPTAYTDGSALPAAQIGAFRIYQGTSPTSLARVAEVAGTVRAATRGGLAVGTHYFAVTAVTVNGTESALSAVGSKVIELAPNPPVLTVVQTTAYRMRQSVDGFEFVALGTVPLGTACDARDMAGYRLVPRDAVTLNNRFDTKPLTIFAVCG